MAVTQTRREEGRVKGRWVRRLLLAAIFLCLMIQPALAEETDASAVAPAKPAPETSDVLRKDYDRLIAEGNLNNAVGRHVEAERAFRAALEACTRAVGESDPACIDVIIRLGLEISNQDRFEEAGLLFERAGSLAQGSDSPLDPPRVLTYQAMDLANRKDFDAALKLVLDANQQRKALIKTEFAAARGADKNAQRRLDRVLTDLAHGLFVQAAIAMRMDRLQEAKIAGVLARRLVLKVDSAPNWWVAFVDEMLAEVELREGNVEAAEKRLERALKTKQLALGNTRAVALSRLALGSVYRRAQRDPEAVTTMRPGLAIVRGELGRAPGVNPKQLLPFLQSAYAEASRTPGDAEPLYAEMFAASQLLNSGSTARTISQMAARFLRDKTEVSGLVAELQEATRKRDQIRLELGRAVVTRKERANKKRIEKLRGAFARAATETTTLESKLAKAFPEYTTFVTALPVSTREISQLLRSDEALVSFVVGDDGGFVFLIRGAEILAAPLDIDRTTLDEAVRHLRAPFEKAGRRIPAFDLAASYSLYRKLLGPVASRLDGVKHLVTVANGTLLSLPFALLVTDPPAAGGNAAYVKTAWLARRMAVSIMPSIRAFTSLRGAVRASQAPKPFIGFGNPAFAGRRDGVGMAALADHCQVGAPTPPELIRKLAALPETADEIKRVARVLGAAADSIHLGAAASEDRLRNMALDRYRVVYFATHGLLPGELRCQSEPSLALSPPSTPADDRGRDGMLEATEIAGLRLDADLVVLSACNTGGGKSGKFGGESLSGLTRAFFQAGARALVVSHWQVDSRATARLMSAFFEQMTAAALAAPEALRRAQMAMIARPETAHPFFWAAFTYVGAGTGPSEPQKSLRKANLQALNNRKKEAISRP